MYKEAKDTEDRLIPAYRESGQIGKMQLKLMADQVLSGWYDLKTSKGQAIYKLNTHFMKANIPKADLIEKAIEGLEHVLKHEAPKVENANFEKKQLKNTIHNLQLLLEEVNGLDDNDEDGGTKKAYYRSKEALFGFGQKDQVINLIKKELESFNSRNKKYKLNLRFKKSKSGFNYSLGVSDLGVGGIGVILNLTVEWGEGKNPHTWTMYYLQHYKGRTDYRKDYKGTIEGKGKNLRDLSVELYNKLSDSLYKMQEDLKKVEVKKAGVQDFVDNFNSKFIRSNLMKSFQSVYDADFRELGVNLKYKAIIKNGQDLGFEAEFKGRTDSFKSVSIYLAANRSRKECFLDYTLIRNKPLSEGGVEKREKRFTRTLESSDFSNSNKGFGAAIDYLLDQLDDPDQSASFKI